MGMEKFFDIVCRVGDLRPSAVVLVATVKALKHHAGDPDGGLDAIERGAANLVRHLGIIRGFGLNARRRASTASRPTPTRRSSSSARLALEHGAYAAEVNEASSSGGEGAAALAEAVVAAADEPNSFDFAYYARRADRGEDRGDRDEGLRRRRRRRCSPAARRRIRRSSPTDGLGQLPICMAKTHLSLSHDPTLAERADRASRSPSATSAPYTGAGWIVALCGDMQTMPGLGAIPAAFNVDIDDGRPHGRPLLRGGGRAA